MEACLCGVVLTSLNSPPELFSLFLSTQSTSPSLLQNKMATGKPDDGKKRFKYYTTEEDEDEAEEEEEEEEEEEDEDISRELGFGEDYKKKKKTMTTTSCSTSNKRGSSNVGTSMMPSCQADSCGADLTASKRYHKRHKVCELHAKAPVVFVAGTQQRFCQQCSRFHGLLEFDEAKRSCRKRLAGHNQRRRKSSSDNHGENSI